MSDPTYDFTGLKATFVDCTLKRSAEPSHTLSPAAQSTLLDAFRNVER